MKTPSKRFKFRLVTEFEVENVINGIKNETSCGNDGISNRLIKSLKIALISPLTKLFNLSQKTGIFPESLKKAKIVPIYKTNDVNEYSNYRPISLLSSISKLLEKLVAQQLTCFMNEQRIFSDKQFGFRTGYRTEHILTEIMKKVDNEKSNGKHTLGIFLDVQKAFDCVDPSIMLKKLQHYGVHENEYNWFMKYLTGRSIRVQIDNCLSNDYALNLGVPQGSVLGPLLFSIYVNDIENAANLLCLLFADDTSLLNSSKNLDELVKDTKIELYKIED